MAKNPAFPFYAQDYLVDTMRWSRDMKSLHIDLLAESWINGALINHGSTTVQPAFPHGLNSEDQKIWLLIKHKWDFKDGYWTNEKLENARKDRQDYLLRQSERGKKSAAKRRNNSNPRSTTVEPVEEEREGEKVDAIPFEESEKLFKQLNENFAVLESNQIWMENTIQAFKLTPALFKIAWEAFKAKCIVACDDNSISGLQRYFANWYPQNKNRLFEKDGKQEKRAANTNKLAAVTAAAGAIANDSFNPEG